MGKEKKMIYIKSINNLKIIKMRKKIITKEAKIIVEEDVVVVEAIDMIEFLKDMKYNVMLTKIYRYYFLLYS